MRAVLDGFFYVVAHYTQAVLSLAAGFLVRLWVPPAVFGATSVVTGVQGYLHNYDGLYRNAIDREVPVHNGLGNADEADRVLRASYTMLLGSAILESLIFIGVGFFMEEPLLRWTWWVFALANFLEVFNTTDRIALKATLRFRAHNRQLVWGGLAGAILMISLSWMWGAYGYFLALVLSAVAVFAISRAYFAPTWFELFAWPLPRGVVRRILAIGGLVGLLKLAQQLLLTADRYLIAAYLDLEQLGYYSLGIVLAARVHQLPLTLAGSYAPRLNAALGARNWVMARDGAEKLAQTSAIVASCTVGVMLLSLRPVLVRFLPEYAVASTAIEWMLIGSYFIGVNGTSLQVHIGTERIRRAILLAAISAVLGVGSGWLLVGYGLTGVAIGKTIGVAVFVVGLGLSAEHLLATAGLVRWYLVGGAGVFATYGLLSTAGRETAAAGLFLFVLWSVWRLSALLPLPWSRVPALVRSYWASGGSRV